MSRYNSIFVLAAFNILAAAFVGDVVAQDAENPELRLAKERFATARENASRTFLKSIDDVEDQLRRARVPGEAKGDKIARILAEKTAFRSSGELPESPELFEDLLKYCEAVHRARLPLQRTYRHLMEHAVRSKNDALLQQLHDRKLIDDVALPGGAAFKSNVNWTGFRTDGSSSTDFKLHVGDCEGTAFRGTVWQGQHKSDAYKIEGAFDGTSIKFRSTQVIRGKSRALLFTGFVLQDRLVARLSGTNTQGKPAKGIVVLRQR